VVNQTQYFRHVEFEQPLTIIMDGKQMNSVITIENHKNNVENDKL
jgi:hypothetical protein